MRFSPGCSCCGPGGLAVCSLAAFDLPAVVYATFTSACHGIPDATVVPLDYVGVTVSGTTTSHTYASLVPFACSPPTCQYIVYHIGYDTAFGGSLMQRTTITDSLVPDYSGAGSSCANFLCSPLQTACGSLPNQAAVNAVLFYKISAGCSGGASSGDPLLDDHLDCCDDATNEGFFYNLSE